MLPLLLRSYLIVAPYLPSVYYTARHYQFPDVWALQSPAFLNNIISCLLCMLSAMQARTSFTSRVNLFPTMHGMC